MSKSQERPTRWGWPEVGSSVNEQAIFQELPVKAPHSPIALPFHLDEQAGTGC